MVLEQNNSSIDTRKSIETMKDIIDNDSRVPENKVFIFGEGWKMIKNRESILHSKYDKLLRTGRMRRIGRIGRPGRIRNRQEWEGKRTIIRAVKRRKKPKNERESDNKPKISFQELMTAHINFGPAANKENKENKVINKYSSFNISRAIQKRRMYWRKRRQDRFKSIKYLKQRHKLIKKFNMKHNSSVNYIHWFKSKIIYKLSDAKNKSFFYNKIYSGNLNIFVEKVWDLKSGEFDTALKNDGKKIMPDVDKLKLYFFNHMPHVHIFHSIENNRYLIPEIKERLYEIYVRAKKLHDSFLKLIVKYKSRKIIDMNIETDLCLNSMEEIGKNSKMNIIVDGSKYQFRYSDLFRIFKTSLTKNEMLFVEPEIPKNPYTNLKFTIPEMYHIYLSMKDTRYTIPECIERFFKYNLDMSLYCFEYHGQLKDMAIDNYISNMEKDDFFDNLQDMFEEAIVYMNKENKKYKRFKIKPRELNILFRDIIEDSNYLYDMLCPILYNYLHYIYNCNSKKKHHCYNVYIHKTKIILRNHHSLTVEKMPPTRTRDTGLEPEPYDERSLMNSVVDAFNNPNGNIHLSDVDVAGNLRLHRSALIGPTNIFYWRQHFNNVLVQLEEHSNSMSNLQGEEGEEYLETKENDEDIIELEEKTADSEEEETISDVSMEDYLSTEDNDL